MRLRNLVLAAAAAMAMAMPAQAQLRFEWHLISTAGTGITSTAQTNQAISPTFFMTNPLVEGQIVTLQLMLRDTSPTGQTFNWGFGDGVIPPPASNINGTGLFSLGMVVNGTPGRFGPVSNTSADRRVTNSIDSELAGPNAVPGATYPLPAADFSGSGYQAYGGPGGFQDFNFANASVTGLFTSSLQDGNPFENGDFPRLRGTSTEFLMPIFNMRFSAQGAGAAMLTLADPFPTPDNAVYNSDMPAPGGDMLDAILFSTYQPLQIMVTPVPEPTSMALVGMALAGLGYRKLRRKKEVVA